MGSYNINIGAIDIGSVPRYNSIEKSISLWGDKNGNSFGKTSANSKTIGMQSIVVFFFPSPYILKRK